MDVVIAKDKVLFSIISFFFWFTQFLYVPILSPYLKTLGGHYTFIGIVLSSYGLMQLFCRLPVGIFSDFLNMRKPFIVFGMMTATCSCLLFAFGRLHMGAYCEVSCWLSSSNMGCLHNNVCELFQRK